MAMQFDRRARAVNIAQFDQRTNKPHLDERAFTEIIQFIRDNRPVIVISVGGVARSGKSFLLNLFVNYLTFVEQRGDDVGWENSNTPLQGVHWAQSRTAVTLGIWMWSRPFLIRQRDGSQVYVLLVDSQGTGDNRRSDVNLDSLVMYISLQISSVQVINVQRYLTSKEMMGLQLCAEYADMGAASSRSERKDKFLFQSLMFVVRDYQSGTDYGEDRTLFEGILKEVDSDDLRDVVVGINNAFKSINAYNLPYPGDKIAFASEESHHWCLSDVPNHFVQMVKGLITILCNMESVREHKQSWSSAEELLTQFKVLKYHLENDKLPQISTPEEVLQEAVLYNAFTSAQRELVKGLNHLRRQPGHTQQDVEQQFNAEVDKAREVFRKVGRSHKYGGSRIWRKYEDMLTKAFEAAYESTKLNFQFERQIGKLEHEYGEVQVKLGRQAEKFSTEVGQLRGLVMKTKQEQAEEAELYQAREESMKCQIEQLQQELKRARNDEEKGRLVAIINQHKSETQQMRQEYESHRKEFSRQIDKMAKSMKEMELSQQRVAEQQKRATEQLREDLEQEQERRRIQEEEQSKNSSSFLDPFSKFIKPLIVGAVTGGLSGGPIGALTGALGAFGIECGDFLSKAVKSSKSSDETKAE